MKRVIRNIEYDTETATKLHEWTRSELSVLAVRHTQYEILYLSPGGAAFVVSYRDDNTPDDKKEMEVLESEAAHEWLETHQAPRSAYEALGFTVEKG